MKSGVLDGLSIGFRTKKFTMGTKPNEPRRTLEEIDLMEVSIVTFPANGKARVSATGTQLNCTGRNRFRRADGVVVDVPLALVKRVARRGG